MKKSKRFAELTKIVDKEKNYPVDQAVNILSKGRVSTFDETFEIAVTLGVDPRHADQNVRGIVSLPHGTGKSKTVLVMTSGNKEKEATEAGADYVGLAEYVDKIKQGWTDVDAIVCTPDVMGEVGKLGKILGPRGLMPSPKAGTVTMDVAGAVKEIKAGRIEFRVDKKGIIHAGIGKMSFEEGALKENLYFFMNTILKLKPSSAKGSYVEKVVLSSTMGPGIKLDCSELVQNSK